MNDQNDKLYVAYALEMRAALPLREPLDYTAQLVISELAQRLTERGAQLEKLIEDRARFPDRPDFVGQMIGSHIGNLKAAKKSSDDYAKKYISRLTVAELKNAELVELLRNAEKVIGQFMPNVGKCFGIDFALLNETLITIGAATKPSPSLVECDACPTSSGCLNTCMKASKPECDADHGGLV